MALGGGTISTYCFDYITTFAQNTLHLRGRCIVSRDRDGQSRGIGAVLWGGWYSDRIGRWPVMVWSNLAYLVLYSSVVLLGS